MKTYKATGIVYGKYWGGGAGAYQAHEYTANTFTELEKQINEAVKSGAIDSGMGYEHVIGTLMTIETIETIKKNGKAFSNSEFETQYFGEDLTEKEEDFLYSINL